MLKRFGPCLVGAALLAVAAQAQERRVIAVSVVDRHGRAIRGLSTENFRAKFRGKPVKILSSAQDDKPRRILIAVDTSASMIDIGQKWQQAWKAVEELMFNLTPRHSLALATITSETKYHTELTQDPDVLHRAVAAAQSWGVTAWSSGRGGTALLDGIIKLVRNVSPPRFADTVCLFTDAADVKSQSKIHEVEADLARSGVRVFVFWVHNKNGRVHTFPSGEFVKAHRLVQGLTESTGGLPRAMLAGNPKLKEVAAFMQASYESITNVYRLEVEFPHPIDKPQNWKLQVVDADGKKRKKVIVAYPHLLVPPKKSPAN